MKTITIFTKKPIKYENIAKTIKEKLSSMKIINDNSSSLFMGNHPKEFEILFTPNDIITNSAFGFGPVFRSQVPIENAYCTDINYHLTSTIKKVLSIIYEFYPEMWIYDDDYDWLGNCNDFLKSNHQDDNSGYKGPNYKDDEE